MILNQSMDRKYFFFDIDGTLLVGEPGHQYLPDTARYALDHLRARGHFVAIATGRSAPMAERVRVDLGIRNMVHDGGYGITMNDEVLEVRPLDREKCLALIDECTAKNVPWAISPYNDRNRYASDTGFRDIVGDEYMKTLVIPDMDPASYENIYKMYIACPPGVEASLEALKALPWCRYGDKYFFVEPIDKSAGIFRMMELLNADIADVVVFGDALNDLSMFRPEWTSIAMGNAVPELKARANYVTTDVDKDGVYNACLKYGWIDPMPS